MALCANTSFCWFAEPLRQYPDSCAFVRTDLHFAICRVGSMNQVHSIQYPFDRSPCNMPLMRFMLHSVSLSEEVLSKGSSAHRLVRLNGLNTMEVIPLPTVDNDVLKALSHDGLVHTEYLPHEQSVQLKLKASDGSLHHVAGPFAERLPDRLWEPIIPDTKVALADVFASSIGDYLVVGECDPALTVDVPGNNIVTARQALELVRIILTAHGQFYVTPQLPISEFEYYIYRSKTLYGEIQHAWTIAVHAKVISEGLYNYLESLQGRLNFICRAYDSIAFSSLMTTSVDTQTRQLYHLAFLVMLATGVFDDLAHIISEFYKLSTSPRAAGLQIQRRTKGFYEALFSQNSKLHTFLTAESTQKVIDAFYPIRDSLQHRELPKGMRFSEGSSDVRNVFQISSEAANSLLAVEGASACVVNLHEPFLEPLPFIEWAQMELIELVNTVLSSIKWFSVYERLSPDNQDKINQSNELFKQGLSQFFGWPEEPLYF